jgi:diacylglycerol kinase (ATP)
VNVRACVIANPAAGNGRGARHLPRVREAFAAEGMQDVRVTQGAGDEARLVREAIADGCDTIVVLGGDGTWSKCATALAHAGSPARMAFLAAGTGNDFVKDLPEPAHDYAAMARLVARSRAERRVDMARVDDQWFLNVAGFAFDVAVLARVERTRWRAGALVYAMAALRELLAYRGLEARLDAGAPTRYLLLAFANGAHFGGAFHVAPGARVDDGMVDAIAISDVPAIRRPALLARAAMGAHLSHPRVLTQRAPRFVVEFDAPPLYEADGELRRAAARTVCVESCPGALRVVAAP